MVDEKLDPDYCKPEENKWEVGAKGFDDGKNTRLLVKLNLNAGVPFTGVLDVKNAPPLLVNVVRADTKITAYGVLLEAIFSIFKMHSAPAPASRILPPSIGTGLGRKLGVH